MQDSPEEKRLEHRIRTVGLVALSAGLVGFFSTFFCGLGLCRWVPGNVALPLSTVESIAVDSKGRIYCALAAHGRIQQYSANGRYLRGWWIDTSGGFFKLKVDSDRLVVQTARTGLRYVFDGNGKLLSQKRLNASLDDFRDGPHVDSAGNRYSVANPDLFPRITKKSRSDHSQVLVSIPIYLWPLSGPLPGWLSVAIGIMLLTNLGRSRRI